MLKTYTFFLVLMLVLHASLLDSMGQVGAKVRKKRRRFNLDHALTELREVWAENAAAPVPDNLNCDESIDELLLKLPDMGSVFYALVNGWYLGQWADYSSCLVAAADSQYVLATVRGTYTGQIEFTRGGIGKYTDGFTTRMGLCFPKQCTVKEV